MPNISYKHHGSIKSTIIREMLLIIRAGRGGVRRAHGPAELEAREIMACSKWRRQKCRAARRDEAKQQNIIINIQQAWRRREMRGNLFCRRRKRSSKASKRNLC